MDSLFSAIRLPPGIKKGQKGALLLRKDFPALRQCACVLSTGNRGESGGRGGLIIPGQNGGSQDGQQGTLIVPGRSIIPHATEASPARPRPASVMRSCRQQILQWHTAVTKSPSCRSPRTLHTLKSLKRGRVTNLEDDLSSDSNGDSNGVEKELHVSE